MTAKRLAAAVVAVLVVAGCGTTTSRSTTGSAEDAPALAYARCMRAHGVSAFPDPIPGHKAQFPDSPVFASRGPVFVAADRACKGQLTPIIGTTAGPSADSTAAFLQYARCMRAHGVSGYPDPTVGKNGRPVSVDLSSLGIDTESPVFTGAARACNGHGIPAGADEAER